MAVFTKLDCTESNGPEGFESPELTQEDAKLAVLNEKLKILAYHDPLTGLLNRQGFRESLDEALDEFAVWGVEPTLIFINIDDFKSVNDRYSHEVGDKLLQLVGARIAETIGPETPFGRLGGDEFAALIQRKDQPDDAVAIANSIVAGFSEPFVIDGKRLKINASCGVARASQISRDLDALIKAADLAMYHAKRSGVGGVTLFEARMLTEQEDQISLESDFRDAIKNGHFQVFYQPLVDLKTRKIVSFEALLRWPHKTRGMISPEIFVPLAEETGLIVHLGAWALREACLEAMNWPETIRIAVNLSPIQFKSPSLLATLFETIATTGLPPSRLELEITESALLGPEAANIAILEEIRARGIRVSMDDFGTGYSSLAYLQNFEFDKIKIDKRFIQNLELGLSNSAIVDAIMGICIQMGIKTTAEGIETEEQLGLVLAHGCCEGQGYLFGRPLINEDARALLARQASQA